MMLRKWIWIGVLVLVGVSLWAGYKEKMVSKPQGDYQAGEDAYYRGDYATALQELQPLAEQGHAEAQEKLGNLYHYGEGVEKDYVEAKKWYRKAAAQGNSEAQEKLGDLYFFFFFNQGDYATALKKLRPLAERGDAEAQYLLGVMYYYGYGVEQDNLTAIKWWDKAADQDHVKAHNRLGDLWIGSIRTHDYAVAHYLKAAKHGDVRAQVILGGSPADLYTEVMLNYDEREKWLHKAAEQSHATALLNLSRMYCNSPPNIDEAVKWFRKAAARKYRIGMEYILSRFVRWEPYVPDHENPDKGLLVEMYEKGADGVNGDHFAEWAHAAAHEGDVEGQVALGILYESGYAVTHDMDEAVKWYRKAAEKNNASAQNYLGKMYENGRGVTQDHIAAYMWFNRAAVQGDKEGYKNCDRLAQKMADAQLAEAKRRVYETLETPDFTLQTFTGERFNLYEQRGKPIFLNFWATWCIPCVAEMPDMQKLQQTLGDSILIVGIDLGESAETVQNFVRDRGFTYTFVLDLEETVRDAYKVSGIPVSVFIDANGMIVRRYVGTQNYETFLDAARAAMKN